MTIKTLNIIMENLTVLGINNLSVVELNNIGAYLEEKGIKDIENARYAVQQYLGSHK